MGTTQPPSSRKFFMWKKLSFAAIPVGFIILMLLFAELWARQLPSSAEFVRFQFFTELKVSRWQYLSGLKNRLLIDQVLDTTPHEHHVAPPESNRPPFDRVPYPYTVKYNNMGFRDDDFSKDKQQKRILVLGDSVSFAKGVEKNQGFADIVEANLPNTEVYNLGLEGCTAECKIRLTQKYLDLLNPDILIIQASGNDIDQTLWRELQSSIFARLKIISLQLLQKTYLLQRILLWRGQANFDTQFDWAAQATAKYYGADLNEIFVAANQKNIPIIALNLPFAYGYHYGGHLSEMCENHSKTCVKNIQMNFNEAQSIRQKYNVGSPKNKFDFVDLTAAQMNISESDLNQAFPHRIFFHDVCHPNALGHAAIADVLLTTIKNQQL